MLEKASGWHRWPKTGYNARKHTHTHIHTYIYIWNINKASTADRLRRSADLIKRQDILQEDNNNGTAGNSIHFYFTYMEMSSTIAGRIQSKKDAPYWLLIEYYWSQKGVNWLSRSRQNACRENMQNSKCDRPHGSEDAAFIIAFSWCFSPRFNICCDMQCDGE